MDNNIFASYVSDISQGNTSFDLEQAKFSLTLKKQAI